MSILGSITGSDAADDAAKTQKDAMKYSMKKQMKMFNIAREDLSWARSIGMGAGEAPGASQQMQDFKFSGFGYQSPDRGDFKYDEAETKPFEFEFDPDDEIYKWKQKETQRLVDQKMASMGNLSSTANLTQSREAMMSLMSREVEDQYNRQWKTYSTNAAEYSNRFNRALTTNSFNTSEDMNKFNREMSSWQAQNTTEQQQWGQLSNLNSIDSTNYWNKINTGLAASGQSANLAQNTGSNLGQTAMQGGQGVANAQMASGQANANLWQGLLGAGVGLGSAAILAG